MTESYEGWAKLELMGHKVIFGHVRPAELYGTAMVRVDVPADNGDPENPQPAVTQYYSPGAVYCLSPLSEDLATAMCRIYRPRPVQRYELPHSPRVRQIAAIEDETDSGDDDDDR